MGEKIKRLRRRALLTQAQLAELLECSVQCVSFWENSYRTPSLSSWRKLADVLPGAEAEIEQLAAGAE